MFPIKVKTAKQLISTDEQSNVATYKFTFSVELPKICKDDLVLITPKLAGILGGCSGALICQKVLDLHFVSNS